MRVPHTSLSACSCVRFAAVAIAAGFCQIGCSPLVVISIGVVGVAAAAGGGGGGGGGADSGFVSTAIIGGNGDDEPRAAAALSDSGFVVGGFVTESATFGLGESGETTLTSAGGRDAFVARYGASGALSFAFLEGGSGDDQVTDVDDAVDGSFLATGTFQGSDADFGDAPTTLVSRGSDDIFVARYDDAGSLINIVQAGGAGSDIVASLSARSDGSFAIAGTLGGDATFGVPGGEVILTGAEGFVAFYDDQSVFQRVQRVDGNVEHLAVGALEDGTVIVAGTVPVAGSTTFNEGEADAVTIDPNSFFLIGYATNGSIAFTRKVIGAAAQDLAVLDGDDVAVTGTFLGNATFGVGEANQTTATAFPTGAQNVFTARFERGGDLVWVKSVGTGGGSATNSIGIDSLTDGSVVITGFLPGSGPGIFGAGEKLRTEAFLSIAAAGGAPGDLFFGFVARYNPDGSTAGAEAFGTNNPTGPQANSTAQRAIAAAPDGTLLLVGDSAFRVAFGFESNRDVLEMIDVGQREVYVTRYKATALRRGGRTNYPAP